ncbi:hypothetical protein RUM44_000874 [Polyplax serrata]|uniref:G-protein coupled receptors family 1 profile domain-containing protein n=1 Tax=Polyplax serrata TaxID=468196 RepID=A0ABR1B6B6_POLSC
MPQHFFRSMTGGGMEVLGANAFEPYKETLRDVNLFDLKLLRQIDPGAFHNLPVLRTIYISGAQRLLSLDSKVFAEKIPQLKTLRIVHSGLTEIPHLNDLETKDILHAIDLESNQIRKIPSHGFKIQAQELFLSFNSIMEIEPDAFKGSQIAKIILKGNMKLTKLHQDSFQNLQSLRFLDLSLTSITFLPTKGLSDLEVLKLQDTRSLKVFPSVYNFDYIKEAELTYPYHCCAFQFPDTHSPEVHKRHQEFLQSIQKECSERAELLRKRRQVLSYNASSMTFLPGTWGFFSDGNKSSLDYMKTVEEEEFHEEATVTPLYAVCGNLSKKFRNMTCRPAPDAFNPCEDIMENWALRVQVWIVAIFALLGNLAVLLVLISSRFRMTVPKFLMCNLAIADFFMGVYLLLIAIMDVRSIGVYFNFAIDWQNGWGCQVAGFLTVLSSELSIFTLTVITCERWYTITYAIHLNRRLKLKTAAHIMAAGWMYSILMAALPLLGISSYSKTSVCLPLENRESADIAYLITLLIFNGLAFWMICTCYGRMYCSIKKGQDMARTNSDMTVAKRMALLVFTDFACWAPITFFGLTALSGYPLIDVSKTKILLVFFYPLNSCANPYLYALLTQQYQRDFFMLLSRYGMCSERAARYKGPTGANPRCTIDKTGCKIGASKSTMPNHRGSLLTTLTSLDTTNNIRPYLGPVHEYQSGSIELLPCSKDGKQMSCTEQSDRLSNSSFL